MLERNIFKMLDLDRQVLIMFRESTSEKKVM